MTHFHIPVVIIQILNPHIFVDLRRHGHYRTAGRLRSSGPLLAERSPFPHRPATSRISRQAGPGTQSTASRSALRPAGGLRDRSLPGVVTAQGDGSLPSPHCCHPPRVTWRAPGASFAQDPGMTASDPLLPSCTSRHACSAVAGACAALVAVAVTQPSLPGPVSSSRGSPLMTWPPQVSSTAGLLGSPPPPHDTIPISPGQTCREHCHPF